MASENQAKYTIEEFQIAIAKIEECVDYKTYCEVLGISESAEFERWQQFNRAVKILTVKHDEEQIEKLIRVAEEIYRR